MNITNLSIAAIRSLCIDGINKANSGHPGMALGSAPILYTLFTKHLIANPENPNWINRDRFVLSAGHASMLLYTMLHLSSYKISLNDLKEFRQLNSMTPGHPENGHTPGVDATSGPLGQGITQAVGMALAEQSLQTKYTHGDMLFNHYTYCLCGDGCLEEGISQEAISFAGHQRLNKLILFYDSNKVTLDGMLDLSSSENQKKRFEAANWNVLEVLDGNNVDKIDKAIKDAKKSDKPTLIIVHTVIGYGSSKQGTSKVHGAPLGSEDGLEAKKKYGYNYGEFEVPLAVYEHFEETFKKRGLEAFNNYNRMLKKYREEFKEDALKYDSTIKNDISAFVFDKGPIYEVGHSDATRNTSGKLLNVLNQSIFNLIGGSADVAGSVKTHLDQDTNFEWDNRKGRNINFGIREFAMASIQNGILLHGGLRTYVGCFLVFADYMKSAIRMSALSKLPAIYLFSHDSIAVGEDGPTHQPIEQLAMLRSIPNVDVFRPCDANEVSIAWKTALLSTNRPTCIILSRQNLPLIKESSSENAEKGGYIASKEAGKTPRMTLIATGSEVSLALEAQKDLLMEGIDVRVVSMPSQEVFLRQDPIYIKNVLGVPYENRMSIEMLSTFGWHKFAPHVMGLDCFGTSAPAKDALKYFKFTKEEVVRRVKEII